jgi:hypothetical protein
MTMPGAVRPRMAGAPRRRTAALRALAAGLAGVAAALLVSCASSGQGLIPASAAGPLKSDFEAVQQSAESANGDCSTTEAALRKTEEDFGALPSSVDAGLRSNLHQGIANLRVRAHEMCVQPGTQTATTTTATTTTAPPTTTSTATTTPTQSTPSTTPTTSGPGGGTAAPGEGEAPESGDGKGNGHGGTGAGEGGAGGVGAGELEGGK